MLGDPLKETQGRGNMALLCYNKGCGLKFEADKNKDGEILSVSLLLVILGLLVGFIFRTSMT